MTGNGSGSKFLHKHAQVDEPRGVDEKDHGNKKDSNKPVAWDENKKADDDECKNIIEPTKLSSVSEESLTAEEIPVIADEQETSKAESENNGIQDVKVNFNHETFRSSRERKPKPDKKEQKFKEIPERNRESKTQVTHLSAADVEELEKLKNREKNSAKMLKKLRSVLNMVIVDDDVVEDEDQRQTKHNKEPYLITKNEIKKSQREIDSYLDSIYTDETDNPENQDKDDNRIER